MVCTCFSDLYDNCSFIVLFSKTFQTEALVKCSNAHEATLLGLHIYINFPKYAYSALHHYNDFNRNCQDSCKLRELKSSQSQARVTLTWLAAWLAIGSFGTRIIINCFWPLWCRTVIVLPLRLWCDPCIIIEVLI